MRNRTRMIAAAAAVTAALGAGSGAAVASAAGGKPSASTASASGKPSGPAAKAGHDAMVAAVAAELRVSVERVSVALRPLFAVGRAEPSSPVFVAAARSLGVSAQQLSAALAGAKQSLAEGAQAKRGPGGPKTAPAEKAGQDAMVAAVAAELRVSVERVSVALRPLFAVGRAEPSSPVFVAAARSLGVSAQQLSAALRQAKQSLAGVG